MASLFPHVLTSEHVEPGTPVILRVRCKCGQPVIAAGLTIADAQQASWRVLRHHAGFANAAGLDVPCLS